MALTPEQLRHGFLIGDRFVKPAQNLVRGPDSEIHLEPKVMEVLVCLVEHAGDVVSRTSLYDAVWGKAVVSDQALTNCISELRQILGDERANPRYIETVPKRGYRLVAPVRTAYAAGARNAAAQARKPARHWLLATVLAAAAGLAFFAWRSPEGTNASAARVVVVPFENPGHDKGLDHLRLALPDEITTLLANARNLVVRPFEHTPAGEPFATGRKRDADHVISGHYYLEPGNRLTVVLEAQEVAGERLVWRARVTVPAGDLLVMREAVAERVSRGLLPALGAEAPVFGSPPASAEAYDLYLRSLALPRHPEPTERAIALLQRAVALDPKFAPAWTALGARQYEHGSYGDGGEGALEGALAAYRTALELDPEAISAAVGVIKLRTESGNLGQAYAGAQRLVQRFGRKAEAHLALAYAYKYGGMLDASQRHCETAYALDPHNPDLRSCAYSFLYAGRLERVQAFLDADSGSYFSHWGTVLLNLRFGDEAAALDAARRVPPDQHIRRFMEVCLEGRRGPELDAAEAAFVGFWSGHRDPELAYALAPMLEYCGRRTAALEFIERAIDKGFCAWPALESDPVWAGLRGDSRFQRVRSDAMACHQRFRTAVEEASRDEDMSRP